MPGLYSIYQRGEESSKQKNTKTIFDILFRLSVYVRSRKSIARSTCTTDTYRKNLLQINEATKYISYTNHIDYHGRLAPNRGGCHWYTEPLPPPPSYHKIRQYLRLYKYVALPYIATNQFSNKNRDIQYLKLALGDSSLVVCLDNRQETYY